jgi:molybdate transport system substrate-binding protein
MWRRLAPALAMLIGLAVGCERGERGPRDRPGEKESLLIFVGAGIRPPVAEIAEVFAREHRVEVIPDYAGSEVLISKIRLAKMGDIYMPGDKHYVDQAAESGVVLSQKPVCYFVPTILVQKGNPKGITGLDDLIKPSVKLGLGDEKACAIGRKSRGIFDKNGISWQDVKRNLVSKAAHSNYRFIAWGAYCCLGLFLGSAPQVPARALSWSVSVG